MENAAQVRFAESNQPKAIGEEQGPCAFVLVIPRIEGPVMETIEKFLSVLSSQHAVFATPARKPALEVVDSWLEHNAAAEYLGVGRSTLYRYAEHHEIESRKFCGRLQYRLSSLDEFKARHVRPSRHSDKSGAIIPSAPRSGK